MAQTDVLRNNADLYKAIYTIVSQLAANHLTQPNPISGFPPMIDVRSLSSIAAKVFPHLPEPSALTEPRPITDAKVETVAKEFHEWLHRKWGHCEQMKNCEEVARAALEAAEKV
jgi:hypothetical protein